MSGAPPSQAVAAAFLTGGGELLQRLFDHAMDAIILADPAGRGTVLAANPAACRMFGYSADEFVGLDRAAIVSSDERDLNALLQRRDVTGQAAAVLRYRRKDGSEFPGELTTAMFTTSDGQLNTAAIIRDVTARKRHEANLAFLAEIDQDFANLSSADEIMRAVSARVGTHLNVTSCLFADIDEAQDSATIEYAWRRTNDIPDVIGVHQISVFVTDEFRQMARAGKEVVICDTQTDLRTDAERYAAFDIHAYVSVPFHRAGVWSYLFIVNDSVARDWREDEIELMREVTGRTFPRLERARAEAALRESEERRRVAEAVELERRRLLDVLETLPVMICLLTPDYHVAFANRAFRERFGESHGHHCYEYCFGNAETCAFCESYEVLKTGRPHHWELAGADGEVIDVYDYPFTDVDGSPMILEMDIDITARRRAEAELGRYREHLEDLVRERTTRLEVEIGERKSAEEALRRYAERLDFLHEVDEAILAAHSAAGVARAVVERAPHLLPCRRASVVLYSPETKDVSLLAAYHGSGHGEPGQIWQGAADVPWDLVLGRLMEGQEYVVADVQALPASSPLVALLQAEGVRGLVYEPIAIHGQFVGALKLGLDVPGPLPDEQREVVHELAVQLTIGLEQARLYEEVQRYADELEQLVRQRTVALRASEARFRTIFEEAAIGIALAEPEGRLVATNPALRRMLGYGEQELAEIRLFDLLTGAGEDGDELPPEVLAGRYDDYTQELQYVRKDGHKGEANVSVSLLREEEGEPSFLLALIEDITERKQAQEALIQTERLAIMGRMAASLAHEVNNPIQSVVGCLGLAMEVLAEGGDAGEYMTVAVEELERAARIVHGMRDLGRQEEGLKERGSAGELVERVLILTQKRAQNQRVRVIWEGGKKLPPVPMVRDQIQQVFLNLVLNAIDAMPEGGALHIRAVPTEGPRGVAVSFADTGAGIAPAELGRLFEAFHSTKELGLGLGLFVSRNIVQQHGGRIDVESELGKGTTFTVWLPGG